MSFHNFINKNWYNTKTTIFCFLLLPFSYVFYILSIIIKIIKIKKQYISKLPIIVVGNITIGGVGKTPVVIEICEQLIKNGYKPAIVSRGYGGKSSNYPVHVNANTSVLECGDEPKMLFDKLSIPVTVDVNRVNAVKYIENNINDINVIVSDDGLQHYKMGRKVEIAVVDANLLLGNEKLLPSGPLRENKKRLNSVDFIISTRGELTLKNFNADIINKYIPFIEKNISITSLNDNKPYEFDLFYNKKMYAVSGISNPKKFYDSLNKLGICIIEKEFSDHYDYKTVDFKNLVDYPIIMTAKDAVKCKKLELENAFVLNIGGNLTNENFNQILTKTFTV